jgi:hypothetical protein
MRNGIPDDCATGVAADGVRAKTVRIVLDGIPRNARTSSVSLQAAPALLPERSRTAGRNWPVPEPRSTMSAMPWLAGKGRASTAAP